MRTTTSTLSLGAGAAALALIGAAGAAVAQESAIEQCRQMANEELRIACLEEALKDAYRTVPAAEDGPAGERPERERGAAKNPPPARSENREHGEDGSREAVAPANPFSPGPEPDPAADAAVRERSELGSEQVEARQQSREIETGEGPRLKAGVSGITNVPYRRLQITLDNGMIWRQIEGDVQRLRIDEDDASTVEIWETRLGGYKLRFNDLARTIRVERIR